MRQRQPALIAANNFPFCLAPNQSAIRAPESTPIPNYAISWPVPPSAALKQSNPHHAHPTRATVSITFNLRQDVRKNKTPDRRRGRPGAKNEFESDLLPLKRESPPHAESQRK